MSSARRPPVLMFPGQGAQHARMAAGLYGADRVFSDTVDRVLDLFEDDGGMRRTWLAAEPGPRLHHVTLAQPLLFTVGYALGRAVVSWGVEPAALIGHSVGELVAATLAGVFEVEDAVAVMRDRVERLAGTPDGGMVTVAAAEDRVRQLLHRHADVAIGAVNAPRQTVVVGLAAPLAEACQALRRDGLTVLPIAATSAFHSPVLAPLFADLGPLAHLTPRAPRIELWSAFVGDRVAGPHVRDRAMWATQPVAPVLFWPTLDRLLESGSYFLTEVGPGQGLATVARRHPAVKGGRSAVRGLLPARPGAASADLDAVRRWIDSFHAEGHHVNSAPAALFR